MHERLASSAGRHRASVQPRPPRRWRCVARCLAAQPVDGPAAGGRGDPAARVGRQAALGPGSRRDRERLLDRLLGEVDVAEDADQGGDDPPVLPPEDRRAIGSSRIRPSSARSARARPGTAGPRPAPGRRSPPLAAHASAASRSGALMTQKPPRCSLVSANGPSVVTTSPPSLRTTVADLRRFEAAGEHPGARGLDLGVEGVDVGERLLHVGFGRDRLALDVVNRQHPLLHGSLPVWCRPTRCRPPTLPTNRRGGNRPPRRKSSVSRPARRETAAPRSGRSWPATASHPRRVPRRGR